MNVEVSPTGIITAEQREAIRDYFATHTASKGLGTADSDTGDVVPLSVLPELFNVSEWTVQSWIERDGVVKCWGLGADFEAVEGVRLDVLNGLVSSGGKRWKRKEVSGNRVEEAADFLVGLGDRLLERLVELRKERNLTLVDVAERMGVSRQTVAEFERYDADPRFSTVRRYALAVLA